MITKDTVEEMILLYEFAVLGVVFTIGINSGDGNDHEELVKRKEGYERTLAILRTNQGYIVQAYATQPTVETTGQGPGIQSTSNRGEDS